MTSLMVACKKKNMAAATELLEATKKAGALDMSSEPVYPEQGFETDNFGRRAALVWSVWCEGCGQVVWAGAGYGGRKEEGDGLCAGR